MNPYATINHLRKVERQLLDVVNAIRAELDGKAWSADTCAAIAGILNAAGYKVRAPEHSP